MQIVCPHCTTSYAIKLETLGEAGRTVRCSRCKEVWLARPEDAVEPVDRPPEGRTLLCCAVPKSDVVLEL